LAATLKQLTLFIESNLADQLEAVASEEQRRLHEVANDALRVYFALRQNPALRSGVLNAFVQSQTEFDSLYKELAR
jgi:hypothetical protein